MKILVINWQDIKNPLGGGAEVHLHEIFSRVARMGHEVTLYCSRFPNAPREENIDGIRVIREGSRYLFNLRVPFAYLRRFRGEGFDVVVDDMNKIPFFTPLFVRTPLVCIVHHLFGGSIFREVNPILGAYVFVTERLAVTLLASRKIPFMVVSDGTRSELVAGGCLPETISVVYNAVDHSRYRITGVPKSPVPLLGYFGRIKRYKSIDQLLRALPILLRELPGLRVVLAGDGDDRPRLEGIVRQLGLDRVVEFTGFITEERKVELLQQVWCKVTTSSKEGWGLTVLEANACGTPVVASDVQGLREAVRDEETGLLYVYGDIADLSRKILRVMTDADLRRRLTMGAIAWASGFTWDRSARQAAQILTHVAGKTAAPFSEHPL